MGEPARTGQAFLNRRPPQGRQICNGHVQSSPGSFYSRLATAGYAYGGEATALRMVTDYL